MKDICILVPNGECNLSSIAGSYKILSRAAELWARKMKNEPYRIILTGVSNQHNLHDGLFCINPQTTIREVESPELIIIPSVNHNYRVSIAENGPLIEWLKNKYAGGAQIASICTGAFLLAETGLLDGKSCSTHWSAIEDFRRMYPSIRLEAERLITDSDNIYTNGGAFSFLNLIIYLVEKLYDRETAILCSKIFQIDPDRQNQSTFAIFAGQKKHEDEMILQAQLYLESLLSERISVSALSTKFHVSRRNFDRRFFRATGNSPLEYLQRLKTEQVKKKLETTKETITEIMYSVGYSDPKAFREVFKKFTGVSPLAYRNRFNGHSSDRAGGTS